MFRAPSTLRYPTVPYWDLRLFPGKPGKKVFPALLQKAMRKPGSACIFTLPFCESMCTFCGCHKRITRRHSVETPYISALLKEWELYRNLFGKRPVIRELHLGGGTPTFFSPENLKVLLDGIFRFADRAEDWEYSF